MNRIMDEVLDTVLFDSQAEFPLAVLPGTEVHLTVSVQVILLACDHSGLDCAMEILNERRVECEEIRKELLSVRNGEEMSVYHASLEEAFHRRRAGHH